MSQDLARSSMYTANNIGDKTEPSRTPKSCLKDCGNDKAHLTHEKQFNNQFSNKYNNCAGSRRVISLGSRAKWLTLSKAFDMSIASCHINYAANGCDCITTPDTFSSSLNLNWLSELTRMVSPIEDTVFKYSGQYRTNGNSSKVITGEGFAIVIFNFRYWYNITVSKSI